MAWIRRSVARRDAAPRYFPNSALTPTAKAKADSSLRSE
jgi:hypothetical protein